MPCDRFWFAHTRFTNKELQDYSRRDGAKGMCDDKFGLMKTDECWKQTDRTIDIYFNTWRSKLAHHQKTGAHHDRLREEEFPRLWREIEEYEKYVRSAADIYRRRNGLDENGNGSH